MAEKLPSLSEAPISIQEGMGELRGALDAEVPPKREVNRNLLIATWNIRAFGGLTRKWKSSENDSPKRNYHGLHFIAEIISRFDVVALQEVTGNLAALRTLAKTLGDNWQFLLSDINLGDEGKSERLGYLFDSRRVSLSGLAGELSAPADEDVLNALSPDKPFRQFARTPYAVSFRAADKTIIMVTAHVLYGEGPSDRTGELAAIGNWMADWADRSNRFHHNLIVLGDFNIDREGDKNFDAFTKSGLTVPDQLHEVPRTIFADGSDGKYYDQIAWFESEGRRKLSLDLLSAGGFNFEPIAMKVFSGMTKQSMSFRVSDHLPLWVEFDLG